MAEEIRVMGASAKTRLRRQLRFLRTRARELKMIGKALVSTKHPILVHIIPCGSATWRARTAMN